MVTAPAQTSQIFKCSLARSVQEGVVHASLHSHVPHQFKYIIKVPCGSHFLSSYQFLTTFALRSLSSATASVFDHIVKIQAPVFKAFKHIINLRKNLEFLFNWDLKQLTHNSSTCTFLSFQRQAPALRCVKGVQHTKVQTLSLVKLLLLSCCPQTAVTSIQRSLQCR